MGDEIRELNDEDFARAIPRKQRERILRGRSFWGHRLRSACWLFDNPRRERSPRSRPGLATSPSVSCGDVLSGLVTGRCVAYIMIVYSS
jgi:hypothetical protein